MQLPSLRERLEDIQPLVDYFTGQICDEVPSIKRRIFSPSALATLQSYSWPGNVRELKFAVERALCVARDDEVDIVDLPHEVRGDGRISIPDSGDFDEQIDGIARGLLMRALEQAQNSQKEAAEQLRLSYDRFRHLLRKHEIIGR